MRHVLIELGFLIGGLFAVAAVTETAAWAYPLGRNDIAWIGRIVAIGVVLWSIPLFRAALAKDRANRNAGARAHG